MPKQFWVQLRNAGGGWYDSIGSNDYSTMCRYADADAARGIEARVVERIDQPMYTPRVVPSATLPARRKGR